ncbi:hypothetical protein Cob_v004385 [Colletotrichum orbiculare MAFF 240422]|uniref:Uncharacterized protein n=1 Tax=Colletotrichum orbiculare (strain 104-T / ATCC 96160 / CBS 514.97 / LARS 414 / MAFF 240422) TaxID=1213857 RepID=N4VBI4_COLOR|nr:hypothetical protein Cob_v004385 [Colletotrichum orbiculare MAFF 240422]
MLVDCSTMRYLAEGANPDVIVSFVGTGCLIVLLLIIDYVFIYDPELDPFRKPGQDGLKLSKPNAIDVAVLRSVRRGLSKLGARQSWVHDGRVSRSMERSFDRCVLAMNDIQIATGLAVLISGYHELPRTISAYHWLCIVYTAWFSSVTHLAAMSHLRTYYANNMHRCVWRLILVCAIILMLLVAMVISIPCKSITLSGIWIWTDRDRGQALRANYAVCLLPYMSNTDISARQRLAALTDTIFSMAMLSFGYVARTAKMSRGVSRRIAGWRDKLRRRLVGVVVGEEYVLRRMLGEHMYTFLVARPLAVTWIFGRLVVELWGSFLAEVFWISVTAAWGLSQLAKIRSYGLDDENNWSFGQIAAIVLFVSPVFLIVEDLFSSREHDVPPMIRQDTDLSMSSQTTTQETLLPRQADSTAANLPIEATRLIDTFACWSSPSVRAAVWLLSGCSLALVGFIFWRLERISELLVTPWFIAYQPLLAFLILLLGMELEANTRWARSRAFRWAAGLSLFIIFLLMILSTLVKGGALFWEAGDGIMICKPIVVLLGVGYGLYLLAFLVYGVVNVDEQRHVVKQESNLGSTSVLFREMEEAMARRDSLRVF